MWTQNLIGWKTLCNSFSNCCNFTTETQLSKCVQQTLNCLKLGSTWAHSYFICTVISAQFLQLYPIRDHCGQLYPTGKFPSLFTAGACLFWMKVFNQFFNNFCSLENCNSPGFIWPISRWRSLYVLQKPDSVNWTLFEIIEKSLKLQLFFYEVISMIFKWWQDLLCVVEI